MQGAKKAQTQVYLHVIHSICVSHGKDSATSLSRPRPQRSMRQQLLGAQANIRARSVVFEGYEANSGVEASSRD